jgi:hypothetical protein
VDNNGLFNVSVEKNSVITDRSSFKLRVFSSQKRRTLDVIHGNNLNAVVLINDSLTLDNDVQNSQFSSLILNKTYKFIPA